MNFQQLKFRAAFLAQQAGSDKVAPQPDWGILVNRGVQDFSWDTEYNEEEASFTTVINQSTYTLDASAAPRAFKSIRRIAYDTGSMAPQNLLETSEADQSGLYPLWWQRPVGRPTMYISGVSNQVRLIPPPDTAGLTVSFAGTREAPPLVNETDTPGVASTYHEAIALRAAVLHCEVWATDDGAAKVQLYRQQYGGLVTSCMDYLASGRFASLQRRVAPPGRRRTFIRLSGRYY